MPTPIQTTLNLADNDCYIFTIEDSEGDGICCDFGTGYYKIETATGATVISGSQFLNADSKSFRINSLSTPEVADFNSIKLYPNPTTDFLNLFVEKNRDRPDSYTIINILGQVIKSKKIAREDNLQINVASLPAGTYFLKLAKNEIEIKTISFLKK
ncbi:MULTISPECIES: T9SS type A sorting domain-containing protein [unclassified Flavobacterium]|uniref:T9SS type A sorting domain-containing protein n=1 Tax=unclassified Flavobacterium TaxID=196869 RepID=UPI00351B1CB1